MTNTTHTKAPWIIQNGTSIEAPDYGWEGLEICQITGIDHKSELPCNNAEEVNQANARLIAAAPDLLEALEAIKADIYGSGHLKDRESFQKVKAAIAKARGQS